MAVVTALLVAALVWSEARYFLSPGYNFKFVPDADYETKLTINVDLTVAMPCDRELGSYRHDVQRSAKVFVRGCEKFVIALAYLFCLALPWSCLARFAYFLADLCTCRVTHQVVPLVLLTSKQRLCFSIHSVW